MKDVKQQGGQAHGDGVWLGFGFGRKHAILWLCFARHRRYQASRGSLPTDPFLSGGMEEIEQAREGRLRVEGSSADRPLKAGRNRRGSHIAGWQE